jgi:hypothetical protein
MNVPVNDMRSDLREKHRPRLSNKIRCITNNYSRFHIIGHVEVYHHANVFDIETTGSNVSGDEKCRLATLELSKDPIALFLTLVAMHGSGLKSIRTKTAGKHVASFLRFNKD